MSWSERRYRRGPRARFFWGLMLVGIGILGTADYLGLAPGLDMNTWWPALLILFGLGRALTAHSPRRLGGGVTTALIGLWILATLLHWHGLRWGNGWPLALVAAGVGEIVHGIAIPFYRGREDAVQEEIHVHE